MLASSQELELIVSKLKALSMIESNQFRFEILVMSHLGLTPQSRAKLGGYRVQGKTAKEVEVLLDQALSSEEIGCCSILLEAVPMETAQVIAENFTYSSLWSRCWQDAVDGQLVIYHD